MDTWTDKLLDLRIFVEQEAFDYDPWEMERRITDKIDLMLKEITSER